MCKSVSERGAYCVLRSTKSSRKGAKTQRASSFAPWRLCVRRISAYGGWLLVALLFLAGCSSVDPVVKIGLVAPFEGRERAVGYDVIYSARLAVREINATGGIGGYRLALVALDDGGDPELARKTAASLVTDPAVVAVIGHWGAQTTAVAAPIYEEAGLAFLPAGEGTFGPRDPATLAPEFVAAYTAVTPFDETPGPYAASAYDAFQLLWQVLYAAAAGGGTIDRDSVREALADLK